MSRRSRWYVIDPTVRHHHVASFRFRVVASLVARIAGLDFYRPATDRWNA